jgi:hypothetical protein
LHARSNETTTSVSTADTNKEPKQPIRLLKNRNTERPYPRPVLLLGRYDLFQYVIERAFGRKIPERLPFAGYSFTAYAC